MTAQKKFLISYFIIGALFIIGSFLQIHLLANIANFLLIPVGLLYYKLKAKRIFWLMVLALIFFYIRDILMFNSGHDLFIFLISSYFLGIIIIFCFAITSIPKFRVHFVEWVSLFIMYGFLGFLFYTITQLISEVLDSYIEISCLYLLLLILLLAITYTGYLLKSHFASLWLMLAAASLIISELSLFFQMFVVSDVSVAFFFPLFHVIAYYAFIEHMLHRRRSAVLPCF